MKSIVLFPVEYFSSIIVFLGTLDPPIFWFDEAVPFCPFWVFLFLIFLFIGISLFKVNQFIQISEHVDEHTALLFPFEEMLKGELYSIFRFE